VGFERQMGRVNRWAEWDDEVVVARGGAAGGGKATLKSPYALAGARMERRCTWAALFEGPRTCTVRGLPAGAASYAKIRRLAATPFNARTCIRLATSAIPAGDPTAQVNSSS
jgi:hypothetical protein